MWHEYRYKLYRYFICIGGIEGCSLDRDLEYNFVARNWQLELYGELSFYVTE